MAKRTTIKSSTTPNHRMNLRSWLAELVMIRANRGSLLPPFFWRDARWKWKYTNEVKAASKFIKKFGEALVVKVVADNPVTTFSDYGNMEFLLQSELDILMRHMLPKDFSPVVDEDQEEIEDIRGPRIINKQKGLFSRLYELEVDNERERRRERDG